MIPSDGDRAPHARRPRRLPRAGDATVFLYATPLGQPLYERLGFRAIGTVTRCAGPFGGAAPGATRAATPADDAAIRALDAAALGADRGDLLRGHLARAERVRVLDRDGVVCGFGAAGSKAGDVVVGPLVAPDPVDARTLISDLAAGIDGSVRIDLDHRHDSLVAWAAEQGVEPGDTVSLMVLGNRRLPGDRDRLIVPMMLAVG